MHPKNCTNALLIFLMYFANACTSPDGSDKEWQEYLGGPDRNHYSALQQINKENIHQLEIAWTYHTLDTGHMQCNPIVVDGIMYGMTATSQPFAINASTGEAIWRNEPIEKEPFSVSRGLVYWEDGSDKSILFRNGEWLYAVNAATGDPIDAFGSKGRVSLKSGLGPTATNKMVLSNTPGTVYQGLIIMPIRVGEDHHGALGHIQAFNIKTGKLAWVFHTIPQPGEFGHDTWGKDNYLNIGAGGANNWAGMAVDRDRGIVYVPTGSAAPDFYGASRPGSNLFANTLLALDASTGKRIWHYQLVHHDILDMDLPAPPNLLTVTHEGKSVDAVAQVTKHGYVFLFDRETGEPLFPIIEKPVPASEIPGEQSWPTQPFPSQPAPFARQLITEDDISPYAENREELLNILRESGYKGPFTPLNEKGMLVFPGLSGGAIWGGAAADKEGILYINSNEMARYMGIGPSATEEELQGLSVGEKLYTVNCAPCHGKDLKGNPKSGYPSLSNISERHPTEFLTQIINKGKGMMPAFPMFDEAANKAIVSYLLEREGQELEIADEPVFSNGDQSVTQPAYKINRYSKFLDSKGYPAISPPWGTLNAIDMNTGDYLWKIPFGEYPELVQKGIPFTGTESFGGPLVTEGGLLFIAGTQDGKFRAYDKQTGELVWETLLPFAAFATPSTYEVNGQQYIVLACGGSRFGTIAGDVYVAFSLPK